MTIPAELHERVFDLATRLTQASERGDTRAYWRLYEELRARCENEAHPFAWETLADFTSDDIAALPLYARALALLHLDDASAALRSCAAPDAQLQARIETLRRALA